MEECGLGMKKCPKNPHLYGPGGFHNVCTKCGFFGYNFMVMDYILMLS